jgi:hypothetical protein
MRLRRPSHAARRGSSLLTVVALVGATLAVAPAFAAATTTGAETASSTPAGPIALTADAVTWDEGGKSGGDDDHLGPGGSSGDNGAEFTTNGYKWERTDLTYGFDNWTPDLSVSQQKAAVGSALNTWAEVTPLTFTEVATCGLSFNHPSCTTPDIRIRFGTGDHGTGSTDPNFDGAGGVVAHAYGPVPDDWGYTAGGDLHLDDAETWKVNGASVDLETVVLHESGHALGLGHTNQSCAGAAGSNRPIMCSVLTGTQRVISADDRNGVQALYGAAPPDLPDGVDVDIIEQESIYIGSNDHLVAIVNGYDTDLVASLDITGTAGCGEPSLSLPDNATTYSICRVDPDEYLTELDTSETLTLTATVSATGVPDASDGPVDIDVVAADHPFSDVPPWVTPAVDWISYWTLADGFRNNTYKPDNDITRAEVTRMIWRYAGEPSVGGAHGFSDVPIWVEEAVTWATFDPDGPTEPFMTGNPDGTFRPEDPISRAEVVRLLYRYVGSPSVGSLPGHGFSDVPEWVQDAVKWAAHDPDGSGPLEPVVSGFPNGTFGPEDEITRAQLTRSLFRLTDQLVD